MITNSTSKKIVTIALPYANGELHLGHISEAIQADIWVRFQKLLGNSCSFVSGSDVHGTPVMISSDEIKVNPKKFVQNSYIKHFLDLKAFHIEIDSFSSTNSLENEKIVNFIYQKLVEESSIETRYVSQPYDVEKSVFLSDRLIRGVCPKCEAAEQYGDGCESCGSTYSAMELKNPYSVLSNTPPIVKKSLHYFFKLSKYKGFLKQWISSGRINSGMACKLEEWFMSGIKDWDISRDSPYFGFRIPGEIKKYFYVWMDAPLGYISSFIKERKDSEFNFLEFWKKNTSIELYHFIGKDIAYFHVLFWVSILKAAGLKLPNAIVTHGFLTLNGRKMSKSRGTLISAKKYLNHTNPEYLRYYLATKFTGSIEDVDLNPEDFMMKVNSDLVGKYINLASRCAKFIEQKFNGRLSLRLHDENAFKEFLQSTEEITRNYVSLNISGAVRKIMSLADSANRYIDTHKPWVLAKNQSKLEDLHRICTQGINIFRILTIYLTPILPETSKKVGMEFLQNPLLWQDREVLLLDCDISVFKPMMKRITREEISALRG